MRRTRSGTTVESNMVRLRLHDIVGSVHEEHFTLRIVDRGEVAAAPLLQRRLQIDDATEMMDELVFFDRAETVESGDMRRVAEEYFGTELGAIETEVGSTLADDPTGKLLGAAKGSPVLVRQQLVFNRAGVPIEVVSGHFRADRVSFVDR